MKTALAVRHLAFEDLGTLEPVLARAGYAVRHHDIGLNSSEALREADPDLLVVLGGPIGVYETDRYPWPLDELDLLANRLAALRPTLGSCLGAQSMARALDAQVRRGLSRR